jgi:uncharacterized protein (TIGR00255 family)
MILSMTGFGKASKIFENYTIKAEIRSLNSKQLDLKTRIPMAYREYEHEIRRMLESSILRGKADFSLEVEYPEGGREVQVDRGLFLSYHRQLSGLAEETGLSSEHLLNAIVRLPNVVSAGAETVSEQEWHDAQSVVEQALEAFRSFRVSDGRPIEADLRMRVELILQGLAELEPFEAGRVERVRQRLLQHLAEWAKMYVDENRLEQELVFYLEKYDLTEEKLRLRQHCAYFLEEMSGADPAKGRKLGFIAQEMGREINTIGSKANAAEIQRLVVCMKDELEKMKEQLANIL